MRTELEKMQAGRDKQEDIEAGNFLRRSLLRAVLSLLAISVIFGLIWLYLS